MKKIIVLLFVTTLAQAGTYEYILNPDGSVVDGTIKRLSDGAFIPSNPDNRDYKAFLTDPTSVIQMPDIPIVVKEPPVLSVQDQLDALKTQVDALSTAVELVATATNVDVILPTPDQKLTPK